MSESSDVFAGRVVLVPPARVGRDVLAELLQRKGPELPRALRLQGARVTSVDAFRVAVDAEEQALRRALAGPPDLLALGNPSAARMLAAGLEALDAPVERCLAAVTVAAVGPATAAAAAAAGFSPDLTSQGHLADLVTDLDRLLRPR